MTVLETDLGHLLSFTAAASRAVLSTFQGCLSHNMTGALMSKVLFVFSSLYHLKSGSLTVTITNICSFHMFKLIEAKKTTAINNI